MRSLRVIASDTLINLYANDSQTFLLCLLPFISVMCIEISVNWK